MRLANQNLVELLASLDCLGTEIECEIRYATWLSSLLKQRSVRVFPTPELVTTVRSTDWITQPSSLELRRPIRKAS